jgi:hypothetical protein
MGELPSDSGLRRDELQLFSHLAASLLLLFNITPYSRVPCKVDFDWLEALSLTATEI